MKIDRLISIIMTLSNSEKVTATELAKKYEVSVKTIQRDIESINAAGVPIVSYRGQDGGYGILDTYKIKNSSMNNNDLYLINTLLDGITKIYDSREINNLKEKFSVIVDSEIVSSNLYVDFSPWGDECKTREKLKLLDKAFNEKRIINFDYNNLKGEMSNRSVEPLKLIFKGFSWYLYAFCLEKKDTRIFKLKRMRELKLGNTYDSTRTVNLEELFGNRVDNLKKFKLKVKDSFLKKIDDYFEEYEVIDDNIITVILPLDEWVYSMILSFGSEVEVIEPIDFRKEIIRRIQDMNNIYK